MMSHSGDVAAMGSRQGAETIVVTCPKKGSQSAELCQSMVASLQAAAPNRRVRQAGQERAQEGALQVTLNIDRQSQHGLSGHLEWSKGAADGQHSGPVVDLDVMDTTLRPSLFRQFTDGLVKVSDGLLK